MTSPVATRVASAGLTVMDYAMRAYALGYVDDTRDPISDAYAFELSEQEW
jgi:hypothetical protein